LVTAANSNGGTEVTGLSSNDPVEASQTPMNATGALIFLPLIAGSGSGPSNQTATEMAGIPPGNDGDEAPPVATNVPNVYIFLPLIGR
jgi:hypothetical protein